MPDSQSSPPFFYFRQILELGFTDPKIKIKCLFVLLSYSFLILASTRWLGHFFPVAAFALALFMAIVTAPLLLSFFRHGTIPKPERETFDELEDIIDNLSFLDIVQVALFYGNVLALFYALF